jgi:hypothetical protein
MRLCGVRYDLFTGHMLLYLNVTGDSAVATVGVNLEIYSSATKPSFDAANNQIKNKLYF